MSKRKTIRPGVREISPVSIWWSLRWKRLEEEVCFKSRVKKRRSDWWWQRWWWQCGSDLCRVVRRWKNRMWMRLTEKVREFIPKAGCCMLKKTVCNFERWESRWSGYGDDSDTCYIQSINQSLTVGVHVNKRSLLSYWAPHLYIIPVIGWWHSVSKAVACMCMASLYTLLPGKIGEHISIKFTKVYLVMS